MANNPKPDNSPILIREKKASAIPNKKIRSVLVINFFQSNVRSGFDNTTEIPTINRKKGKTKSVGVQPCHAACSRGEKMCPQSPGLFTIVIIMMVNPRSTSTEIILGFSIHRFSMITSFCPGLCLNSNGFNHFDFAIHTNIR